MLIFVDMNILMQGSHFKTTKHIKADFRISEFLREACLNSYKRQRLVDGTMLQCFVALKILQDEAKNICDVSHTYNRTMVTPNKLHSVLLIFATMRFRTSWDEPKDYSRHTQCWTMKLSTLVCQNRALFRKFLLRSHWMIGLKWPRFLSTWIQ